MKKLICLLLTLVFLLITVGCKGGNNLSDNISSEISSSVQSSAVSSAVSEAEENLPTKEQILNGEDPKLYELAIDHEGNKARIAALMKKAEKGGNFVIGAIGGSITQGAGANGEKRRYVNHVFNWWKENFPKATFTLVNAGIGASNAEMACYRLETDLLSHNPDFVIVDFSVNTYLNNDQIGTYQTLLYKIMSQKNSPAVMSVHFTSTVAAEYENGGRAVRANEYPNDQIKAAIKKYDVPSVNYDNYVWTRLKQRAIRWKDIGADYIHPSDGGHKLTGYMFAAYLSKVKENLANESTTIPALPKLDTEKYLNLDYVINTVEGVKAVGFTKEGNTTPQTRGWKYTAGAANASLTVPLPKNSNVVLFLNFGNTEGKITLKGANGATKTQDITVKNNHVLMHFGAMGDSVTIIPEITKGEFRILGIGIEK